MKEEKESAEKEDRKNTNGALFNTSFFFPLFEHYYYDFSLL